MRHNCTANYDRLLILENLLNNMKLPNILIQIIASVAIAPSFSTGHESCTKQVTAQTHS